MRLCTQLPIMQSVYGDDYESAPAYDVPPFTSDEAVRAPFVHRPTDHLVCTPTGLTDQLVHRRTATVRVRTTTTTAAATAATTTTINVVSYRGANSGAPDTRMVDEPHDAGDETGNIIMSTDCTLYPLCTPTYI